MSECARSKLGIPSEYLSLSLSLSTHTHIYTRPAPRARRNGECWKQMRTRNTSPSRASHPSTPLQPSSFSARTMLPSHRDEWLQSSHCRARDPSGSERLLSSDFCQRQQSICRTRPGEITSPSLQTLECLQRCTGECTPAPLPQAASFGLR